MFLVYLVAKGFCLTNGLAERMVGMVRFRNILVHDYLEIDSLLVHTHLQAELDDFEQFAQIITKRFLV